MYIFWAIAVMGAMLALISSLPNTYNLNAPLQGNYTAHEETHSRAHAIASMQLAYHQAALLEWRTNPRNGILPPVNIGLPTSRLNSFNGGLNAFQSRYDPTSETLITYQLNDTGILAPSYLIGQMLYKRTLNPRAGVVQGGVIRNAYNDFPYITGLADGTAVVMDVITDN